MKANQLKDERLARKFEVFEKALLKERDFNEKRFIALERDRI